MTSFIKKVSTQLFEPYGQASEGELLFFRLFEIFVMVYVIFFSWKWGLYMPHNTTVIKPLGIANYLPVSFLFTHFVSLINAGLITAFTILSFSRFKERWFCPLAMLLFHLQFVGRYSQGKTPHGANYIGMALLIFSIGFIFFKEINKRRCFILGTVIFFIGLGYTSAAVTKLLGTGINWPDGSHLWLWLAEKKTDILSRNGSFTYNRLQQLALYSHTTATLILSIGWITEFCGFLIWWKRFRPYIATGLILMHLGIAFTLNIRFDPFIYELILIGYPWATWFNTYIYYIPARLNIKD